jgi:alkanesulfonate monooxygenase SsuD/methylene tetrahydromethanopterin reductase-like flavin-dependent oxidoreductase (luciferase family)
VETGRRFEDIERTVTVDVVIRDNAAAAQVAWADTAQRYAIEDRTSSDGEYRGLTVGGPVADVAEALDAYRRLGIGELIFVFRQPFDLETIERLGELRAALG